MTGDYTQVERIVSDAFGEAPAKEAIEPILSELRLNLERADEIAHRGFRNTIVSIAAYEFMLRAAIADVSYWGFRLSDLSILRGLLPLMMAFFYYQAMTALAARRLHVSAYDNTMHYRTPGVSLIDLRSFLRPPSLFGTESLLASLVSRGAERAWGMLGVPVMFAVLIGPPVAVGAAFYRNSSLPNSSFLLALSLGLPAALLLARGLIAAIIAYQAVNGDPGTS